MEKDKSITSYFQEYVDAHNKMRTEPQTFIPILKARLKMFNGNNLERPGRVTTITKEGPKAVKYV